MRALAKLALVTAPTVVASLAVAEVALRVVVPAAEFPLATYDARHGIMKNDVRGPRAGVYTIGPAARTRARWRLNDDGWNSAVEYPARRTPGRPRVVLVGDSYVEALQVDVDRNVGAVLRGALGGGTEVFALGISGASLSQYLQMSRYAARVYRPDVLVINVVHNDFDASVRTLVPLPSGLQFEPAGDWVREVAPVPYAPSRLRRLLYHSALVRYVFKNCRGADVPARLAAALGVAPPPATPANANADPDRLRRNAPLVRRTVDAVVRTMRAENPGTRIVFMMDAPRADLYAGTLATSTVGWLTPMLRRAVEAHGCEFVDLTPTFARDWTRHHRLLNDRDDFHWNEVGHRLAAEALLATLRAGPRAPDAPDTRAPGG